MTKSPGIEPAPFTVADVLAMQSFSNGKANEDEQRRAFKWILESACALPVWAYREGQRDTDVSLGRHFVGQQIIGITRQNVSKLRKKEESKNG